MVYLAVILAIVADLTLPKLTSAETSYFIPEEIMQIDNLIKIEKGFTPGTLPVAGHIEPRKTISVVVTAYSSTPDQTDSTPFITASGSRVHPGTLAANFLPFGTKVRFPEFDKDRIFIVEDRMNKRFSHRADIWMETREEAKQFGLQRLKMEIF